MQLSPAQQLAMQDLKENGEGLEIIGGPYAVSKGQIHARTANTLKGKGLVKIDRRTETALLTAKGKKLAASL